MVRTSVDAHEPTPFWPFVISRGRTATYRVVVAPDFLCEARLTGVLWDLAGGEPTEPGHARYRVVTGTRAGDFVLMFRVLLANSLADPALGAPGRDEHGRRIPVISGTIERGTAFSSETRTGVLDEAHRRCLPALRGFWRKDDSAVRPEPAQAFLGARGEGERVAWEELPAFSMPSDDTASDDGCESKGPGSDESDGQEEPQLASDPRRYGRRWRVAAGLAAGAAAGWAAVTRRGWR
ncbi:hypothetical protein ACL02U_22825 [Streptomyces sp. MS06]|uniref:hypothetical protein n=1 Tax=Streptomyces sp. MS06 TaxID=3385974 RepID=UPI0039A38223